MSAADRLAHKLKAKRCGKYFLACCPAHDDRTPSLSFFQGHTAIVVKCFCGCEREDIIAAFRARGLWEERARTSRRNSREMHR